MMNILETLNLNDYLSTKSNWHRRILYNDKYQISRNFDFVDLEYEKERYNPILNYLLKNPQSSIEELKQYEFKQLGMDMSYSHIFSVGENIFRSPLNIFRALYYEVIKNIYKKYATGKLCELGCGYGFNIELLKNFSLESSPAYGGELSDSCINIAKLMNIDVSNLNYS